MHKRISRRAQTPSVWQALNTPIAYPSPQFAENVFLLTAVILLMVWLAPYWNQAQNYADITQTNAERVAGVITYYYEIEPPVPAWYYTVTGVSSDVVLAFGEAADEVLDISEPVEQLVEFYEPGVEAVWGAWLELMADPY